MMWVSEIPLSHHLTGLEFGETEEESSEIVATSMCLYSVYPAFWHCDLKHVAPEGEKKSKGNGSVTFKGRLPSVFLNLTYLVILVWKQNFILKHLFKIYQPDTV